MKHFKIKTKANCLKLGQCDEDLDIHECNNVLWLLEKNGEKE